MERILTVSDPKVSSQVILSTRGVSKRFPGVQALSDVSLDVRKGEIHAVMGENGAGKSTLMKILAGVYIPDEGQIFLDGKQVKLENPLRALQLGISLINQELNIAGNISVAENVFMGSELGRFGLARRAAMRKRTQEVLDLLGAPFAPEMRAGLLSIAEKQQIEIARALVHNSRVIIMDEPTAALSENETEKLFTLVDSLRSQGIAIVYISHRINEIMKIADRVSVLRDGRYIGTLEGTEIESEAIVRMMVGRTLTDFYQHRVSTERTEGFFRVEGFSDGKKVKNVSFSAAAGEIVGIAGLVGSGRTEFARMVFGADRRLRGEVFLDGKRISINAPKDAIRHGIGYVPEDRKSQGLFLEMSSHDNITMNVIGKTSRAGLIAARRNNAITSQAIEQLNIRLASPRTRAVSLSGGNQQKLLLARWLQIAPKVLILDEPTRGVDVGAKSEIYKLIGEIAMRKVAVIFISSELPEVVGIAQRVLVMREGALVADLKGADINQETIIAYATGVREPQAAFAAKIGR
jgi:ribose transport system ATP-binding protein